MTAFLLAVGLSVSVVSGVAATEEELPSTKVSFREDVMPILQMRCLECHRTGGPGEVYSGLNMETFEGLMRGTRFGPVVVPGQAMVSNLNVMVEGKAGIRMPHNRKRLTKCETKILRDWVNQGAKNN
ncbi:MAG: hypothetical protein HQL56_02060 [Magnetococcales bacterium]|nr:hypothetical protein [Magnetococcales bacterium]